MSLPTLMEDAAEALAPIKLEIPELSIYPGWWDIPTPPAIDIYPGNPFQTFAAFNSDNQVFLVVRARVLIADVAAGQGLLLRLLDPTDPAASVELALNKINLTVTEGGVSGFTVYADDSPVNERMLGCEWRVTTYL